MPTPMTNVRWLMSGTIIEGVSDSGEQFLAITRGRSFGRGEGLPGRVWAAAEPAWIVDVTHDTNFPRAREAARSGLASGFAFPMRSPRGVLGAIEFFTATTRKPD